MTTNDDITAARLGLRSYDITMGFRNLETNSGLLVDHKQTHVAGMAAQLAGAIKGRDVIPDARRLKEIAAEVMNINQYAFDEVIRELYELELVRNVKTSGGEIVSFSEQVPLAYDDVHDRLGISLQNKTRSERADQLIAAVDSLARGPMSEDDLRNDLGFDLNSDWKLKSLAESAELVRQYTLGDGTQLTVSPLYAFEQPDHLVGLFQNRGTDEVREAFGRIREQPGYAVTVEGADTVLEDMIRLGLVHAPTVVGADRQERAFLTMPYGLDKTYLTSKKQILEKALALIACIRCGQVSGGVTAIRSPDKLLAALADPDRDYTLNGHSSTQRQYATLIRLGVIVAVPKGNLLAPKLAVSQGNRENLEVVQLARTLLSRQGEGPPERGGEGEAARLLFTGDEYLSPIETISTSRKRSGRIDTTRIGEAWRDFWGW